MEGDTVCVNCAAVFAYKNKRYDHQGLCTNLARSTVSVDCFLSQQWPQINITPTLKNKFICCNCTSKLAQINTAKDKMTTAKRKFQECRGEGVLWLNKTVVTLPLKKRSLQHITAN